MSSERAPPSELETVARLRVDEGALDRALTEARAAAEALVGAARAEAARRREEARAALAAELAQLDAAARAELEREAEAARTRAREVVVRGLRARADERRARVVARIVALVLGEKVPP